MRRRGDPPAAPLGPSITDAVSKVIGSHSCSFHSVDSATLAAGVIQADLSTWKSAQHRRARLDTSLRAGGVVARRSFMPPRPGSAPPQLQHARQGPDRPAAEQQRKQSGSHR